MIYRKIFGISVFHDYFSNNLLRAFSIQPGYATNRRLSGHGLILKETINGINILTGMTAENMPLIPIENGTLFEFDLFLRDHHFPSYTNLSTLDSLPSPTLEEGEKELLIFTSQGLLNGGMLNPEKQAATYKNPQLWARISIDYQDFLNLPSPPDFNIQFEASTAFWSYYFITSLSNTVSAFSLTDGNSNPALTFDTPIDFSTDPGLGGPIAEHLMEKFTMAKGFLIRTSIPLKYQEQARKNIRLLKAGNILINHMPNPSYLSDGNSIMHLEG